MEKGSIYTYFFGSLPVNDTASSHTIISLRLLGSLLLLLSGVVVYWLFQPDIVLFQLMHISNPHAYAADSRFELALKYYFADAVWCLALAQVVTVLRDCSVPRGYRQILTALPFLSETMQLIGVLPGVFDWIDLAIYALIMIPTISKEFKPVNKMEKNITGSVAIAVFTFAILASNGGPKPEYMTGTFTLADRENDIFTKSALIKSLKLSSSPSIVLRVPDPGDKVTEEQRQKNSVLYNLIEKEFAKAGFVVRDRQLFAKVLEQETSDYSKIGLITETDFILELLTYDLRVRTEASKYVDDAGQTNETPYPISFNSAMAEFKLISVKKNDMVGSYTFYYTPCTEGCKERFDVNSRSWSANNSVPTDFFKDAARQLVEEMGLLR